MDNQIVYISDPSHSYLRVPVRKVENLGFMNEISEYSFFNNHYVWLECDCDAQLFFDALDERGIQEPTIYMETLDKQAPFRLYPRFSPKSEFVA
jgi:hypothetical protein